jgi:hypothetical protein
MHADELSVDVQLVRRLLARQFPEWADLPIERSAVCRRTLLDSPGQGSTNYP